MEALKKKGRSRLNIEGWREGKTHGKMGNSHLHMVLHHIFEKKMGILITQGVVRMVLHENKCIEESPEVCEAWRSCFWIVRPRKRGSKWLKTWRRRKMKA